MRLPLLQQPQNNKTSHTNKTKTPHQVDERHHPPLARAPAQLLSAHLPQDRILSRPQRREELGAAALAAPVLIRISGLRLATVRRLQHLHVMRVHRVALAIQSDAKATAASLRVHTRRVSRFVPIHPGSPRCRRRGAPCHDPCWSPARFGTPPQRTAGIKGGRPVAVRAAEAFTSATTSDATIGSLPCRGSHAREGGGSASRG